MRKFEQQGILWLKKAALPFEPFRGTRTQYFILGDGWSQWMSKSLKKVMKSTPKYPAISIDPAFAKPGRRRKIRNTKKIRMVPLRAEKYSLRPAIVKKAVYIVILAHCAHTSVRAFVTRINKIKAKNAKVFAACYPCHSPGLRGKFINKKGWQILVPPESFAYKYAADNTRAISGMYWCGKPRAPRRINSGRRTS